MKNLRSRTSAIALSFAFLCTSAPVFAEEQDSSVTQDPEAEEMTVPPATTDLIVVEGTRIRGQLFVEEKPIAEFNEEDIAAFGASSIADVIAAIEPATGSGARGSRGGGRPVFLINGIRVSSWREFRSYPPEAIRKVEVFPEETAQRFGYSADQRVVNILLKPNFRSVTAEVEVEGPDRGGFTRNEQELTFLRIGDKGRLNFNLDIEDSSLLTEAERDLIVESGQPGEAQFRSLRADTMSAEGTVNYARAFIDSGLSMSLNGTFNHSESRSLSGLSNDGLVPLERRGDVDTASVGATFSKPVGDWNAVFTNNSVYTDSRTEIDSFNGSGFDIANSQTWRLDNAITLTGYPIALPAGDVSVTVDYGLDWVRISSDDTRSSLETELTRRRFNGRTNLSVPISEVGGHWGAIGGLSLNFSSGFEDLSDFGTLANWSAGANWRPTDTLGFSATRIWREVAPGLSSLGDPRIDEFNVPIFDYSTGDTVLATLITGGNSDLLAETQADWKFSGNWELPFWENARFQVDYGINRSRDVTASPGFSAAFEEAFPDRVIRSGAGELLALDRRPLTLFETRSRVLSFGLNTRGQIGKAPEREERGSEGRRGPPQGGGERSRGAGGRFDPAQMQAVRETFCSTPEGEMPDLTKIPEMFRARLLDADGNPDPEKIAAARQRFCGEEAEQRGERFAAMREAICADPPKLDGLPEEMLARLKDENGEIDPEKLKAMRERMCSASGGENQQGGQRGGGGFGRMFGGGDEQDTRPRYFLSFNHNIVLENEVLLAQDGPLFDQLAGNVLSGGAISENTSRLEAGLFWQGYGMRLSGRYTGEATLLGGDLPGSSDLFFGDLATFDVRLFADLGEVLDKEEGWFKGLRLSLVADNVFDARRSVVDENGETPAAFEPFRIDPVGRYLGIDIRKAF
ncbi:hypothetical protein [Qipengyuania psychrotolerans]|uniref:TonB-dependent receptor plug domain-containing protein n=1 Tax=Qipengyuania psychrotolerans TaxID=2867238 RepID=A0ABX8ZFV5_9SPHN|nr:hypothetical protein [Qipengyuania psychrotolerans]QZD87774.1 hypothetical protein K3166_03480 [Qipengyuania psychrotolerans]